jgi:hypothetical protein
MVMLYIAEAYVSYAVNNRSSYTLHAPRAGMAVINFKIGAARAVSSWLLL